MFKGTKHSSETNYWEISAPNNKDFNNLSTPPNRTFPLFLNNITLVPWWHYDLMQNKRDRITTTNGIVEFIAVVLGINTRTKKTAMLGI